MKMLNLEPMRGHRLSMPRSRRHCQIPRGTCIRPQAFFGGFKKNSDVATTDKDTVDGMDGFMFDPSMQRWIKAPGRKVTKEALTVKPFSGGEYIVWPAMHKYLTDKKLKSVEIEEALKLMEKGAMLMDVRLGLDYENEHAEGAVSVPLFRLTAGNEKWDKIKKIVMAGLNMRPTERDPNFLENATAAVGGNKRKKVIVMCTVGGTLDTVVRVSTTGKSTATDKDRAFGRESRSLKACYELMQGGFTNVLHLKGGLGEWRFQGYPIEK